MYKQNFAVIVFQGKQHKVCDQEVITVDSVTTTSTDPITLHTLFTFIDGEANFHPKDITGVVVENYKGKKIKVLKFKRRKGYKVLKGYRSSLSSIRINFQ